MAAYQPPLEVVIVHARESKQGPDLAKRLDLWLAGDPRNNAGCCAEIPVRIFSTNIFETDNAWRPKAKKSIVYFLYDVAMLREHEGLDAWAKRIRKAASETDSAVRVICVSIERIEKLQMKVAACLERNQFIFAHHEDGYAIQRAQLGIVDHLAKELVGDDTQLFLSHTKIGFTEVDTPGVAYAEAIRGFLSNKNIIKPFFDATSIRSGSPFEETLRETLLRSVVVVILTDLFSSRYWCRFEVMNAKRLGRPMVLVDALEHGEPISIPYAGNVQTIRWPLSDVTSEDHAERVVTAALYTLVADAHHRSRCRAVVGTRQECGAVAYGHYPELASLPSRTSDTGSERQLIVHPDPPLAAFELNSMRELRPDLAFASVSQFLAFGDKEETTLGDQTVALSLSNPEDMLSSGLSEVFVSRLWLRLASTLTAAGARLVYAGDSRSGGYTNQLVDLLVSCMDTGRQLPDAAFTWVYPVLSENEEEQPVDWSDFRPVRLERVMAESPTIEWDIPDEHLTHVRDAVVLTRARKRVTEHCTAHVFMGGTLNNRRALPGVLEEFLLSMEQGRPCFLIGAIGGVAAKCAELLQGEQVTFDSEFAHLGDDAEACRRSWQEKVGVLDLEGRLLKLKGSGFAQLCNGLSEGENSLLASSTDVSQIIGLVALGLRYLKMP